ncbi:Putative Fe-S oxidoreductase [Ignavibacterium album JCM 16511]|uniref:Putative Fe-S oxidoreductase n=1 Tax=Ignavibacterium album (strain DSM 19864 / JCM 16511 / NBRC 101810 / Mat9-16) TaxID=945713 RepID=I0AK09_IGNAJ|nr:radical SAM protein [Ignavibacterium album]AFH49316.1 Putative Fe-S oxidoreductase [Ignavibacterium album JCM 16511]
MLTLNHLDYYRLPWNLTDNSISWLEPTSKCNLYCEGCYRKNEKDGHKSLDEIKKDLDVFTSLRKSDGISIAGGDPLTHPDILDIVTEIKSRNLKPIINTNGLALTKDLLKKLKKAGVFGFTFHIDSKQNRPGWKGKNEIELNELRYHYAKMLAEEGNISCAFNSTVYDDTKHFIPEMLKWAHKNIDIVQVMVFILYRAVNNKDFDYYIGPKKIDMNQLVYNEDLESRADLKAQEIVEIIRSEYPDFNPCAYLNGSEKPDSFKWLLTGRLGTKQKIYGYLGSKSIEAIQMFNHLLYGRYLAYASPKNTRRGKSILLLSGFDKKLRKAFKNFYKNPFNIFRKLYYQSVMIIQPVDFLQDGRQNMCDGCPDITVWNGQLVWSCRMEEQLNFGMNVKTYPKGFMN